MQMGSLRWIEAVPLAILAAYLNDHRNRSDLGGKITVPERYEFLQRMDFFKTLGVKVRETFRRRPPSGRFVPVRQIGMSRQVYEASAEIVETLRIDDTEAANVLRHCIGEMIDNVFVHANSPTNATICAQHFPNACRTQVGIVDTGYGRLGVGLFIVTNVLKEVGGRIQIASGNALFHRERWFTVQPWCGSIIGFEVPDTPLVSYEKALRVARERAITLARSRERVESAA